MTTSPSSRVAIIISVVHERASVAPPSAVPAEFLRRLVEEAHPLEIWLFGSRAKGSARADSDWDFLLVLPDDAPSSDLDVGDLWRRLRDLRLLRVEPLPITQSDFEQWRYSLGTLAQIVSSEGVVVWTKFADA